MKNLLGQSTEWICHRLELCAHKENAMGEREEGVGTCVKHVSHNLAWRDQLCGCCNPISN